MRGTLFSNPEDPIRVLLSGDRYDREDPQTLANLWALVQAMSPEDIINYRTLARLRLVHLVLASFNFPLKESTLRHLKLFFVRLGNYIDLAALSDMFLALDGHGRVGMHYLLDIEIAIRAIDSPAEAEFFDFFIRLIGHQRFIAGLNMQDQKGYTPFLIAACNNSVGVFERLCLKLNPPFTQDNLRALMQSESRVSRAGALHFLMANKTIDCIEPPEFLIRLHEILQEHYRTFIVKKTNYNQSVLHIAFKNNDYYCWNGNPMVCSLPAGPHYAIIAGLNEQDFRNEMNIKDDNGYSPIDYMVERLQGDAVKFELFTEYSTQDWRPCYELLAILLEQNVPIVNIGEIYNHLTTIEQAEQLPPIGYYFFAALCWRTGCFDEGFSWWEIATQQGYRLTPQAYIAQIQAHYDESGYEYKI